MRHTPPDMISGNQNWPLAPERCWKSIPEPASRSSNHGCTVGAESAPIKAGDAIPLRVGETKAFENTGAAPLEFLVVGIARDMAKKNDMLATPPQRMGAPPAARPTSDSRGRGM